jgi:two-component system response regulator CpxR
MEIRYRILVVEDDEEMNALEREFLEVYGLDTLAAYDGIQALDVCDSSGVDAVLLDVMLPEKDGFETCRQLRERAGRGLAIVMLTALAGEEFSRRGMEAGADAYFTKPFDPDEVAEKILQLLGRPGGGAQIDGDHGSEGDSSG